MQGTARRLHAGVDSVGHGGGSRRANPDHRGHPRCLRAGVQPGCIDIARPSRPRQRPQPRPRPRRRHPSSAGAGSSCSAPDPSAATRSASTTRRPRSRSTPRPIPMSGRRPNAGKKLAVSWTDGFTATDGSPPVDQGPKGEEVARDGTKIDVPRGREPAAGGVLRVPRHGRPVRPGDRPAVASRRSVRPRRSGSDRGWCTRRRPS